MVGEGFVAGVVEIVGGVMGTVGGEWPAWLVVGEEFAVEIVGRVAEG